RLNVDSALQDTRRLVVLLLSRQCDAQGHKTVDKVWSQLDGPPQVALGFVEPPSVAQGDAKVVEHINVIWLSTAHEFEQLNALGALAALKLGDNEVERTLTGRVRIPGDGDPMIVHENGHSASEPIERLSEHDIDGLRELWR